MFTWLGLGLIEDHDHIPKRTGRKILGWFQKDNCPRGEKANPYLSTGDEARCMRCGARLIVHDEKNLPNPVTEISEQTMELPA